jgi:hypothetical protein
MHITSMRDVLLPAEYSAVKTKRENGGKRICLYYPSQAKIGQYLYAAENCRFIAGGHHVFVSAIQSDA